MKHIIQDAINVAMPKFSFILEMFTKPILYIVTVVPVVVVTPIVDFWSAFHLLKWLFIIDFATGLTGSYIEWKKSDRKDKWFFGKGEGFSSDKFKKMFIKLIVYVGAPWIMFKFQETFAIKNVKYESVMDAEMNIPTVLILIFCLNEGFSIFNENLPKCGFNLWERIKKMLGLYKELKNEISE